MIFAACILTGSVAVAVVWVLFSPGEKTPAGGRHKARQQVTCVPAAQVWLPRRGRHRTSA